MPLDIIRRLYLRFSRKPEIPVNARERQELRLREDYDYVWINPKDVEKYKENGFIPQ